VSFVPSSDGTISFYAVGGISSDQVYFFYSPSLSLKNKKKEKERKKKENEKDIKKKEKNPKKREKEKFERSSTPASSLSTL
jgi:hypothetical protein